MSEFTPLPRLHTTPAEALTLQPPPGTLSPKWLVYQPLLTISEAQAEWGMRRPHLEMLTLEGIGVGNETSPSTLRVHFSHLPLEAAHFLVSFGLNVSFFIDFLLIADSGVSLTERPQYTTPRLSSFSGRRGGRSGGACTFVEAGSLYPKLPKSSSAPPSKGELFEYFAHTSVPYHWKVKLGVKQRWTLQIFGNFIPWSLDFFCI